MSHWGLSFWEIHFFLNYSSNFLYDYWSTQLLTSETSFYFGVFWAMVFPTYIELMSKQLKADLYFCTICLVFLMYNFTYLSVLELKSYCG